MTPGERCDEIMKLIDETLADMGAIDPGAKSGHTAGASSPAGSSDNSQALMETPPGGHLAGTAA